MTAVADKIWITDKINRKEKAGFASVIANKRLKMKQRITRLMALALSVLVTVTSINGDALIGYAEDAIMSTPSELQRTTAGTQASESELRKSEKQASDNNQGESAHTGTPAELQPENRGEALINDLPIEVERNYISISAKGFKGDYDLTAYEIDEEDIINTIDDLMSARHHQVIDCIQIDYHSGIMKDPTEGVTVELSDYIIEDPDNTGLYHIKDFDTNHEKIEKLDYEYDADDHTVTFKTKSFSPFVFATKAGKATDGEIKLEDIKGETLPITAEGFIDDEYEISLSQITDVETLQSIEDALQPLDGFFTNIQIVDSLDIELESGEMVDEEAGVKVTLNDYTLAEPKKTKLYHIRDFGTENQSLEKLDYEYDADAKTVTFTTTSFSPFVFVKKVLGLRKAPTKSETTSLTASIVWSDESNTLKLRPSSVTVSLYADGEPYTIDGKQVTGVLNVDNNWTMTFSDLPAGKVYTAAQSANNLKYYSQNTSNILNEDGSTTTAFSNSITFAKATVKINWNDLDNTYGKRPDEVLVKSWGSHTYGSLGNFYLTKENNWEKEIIYPVYTEESKKYIDSNAIYHFYADNASNSYYSDGNANLKQKDPKDVITLNMSLKTKTVSVQTEWIDSNNQFDTRPNNYSERYHYDAAGGWMESFYDNYKILDENNQEVGILSKSVDANVTWYYVLAVDEAGNDIDISKYKVALAEPLDNYDTNITTSSNSNGNLSASVTNVLKSTSFTANISWEGETASDSSALRPSKVVLTLYARVNNEQSQKFRDKDDKVVAAAVSTTEENTYTWEGLPAYDKNGNEITYSVQESTVPSYSTSVEDTIVSEDKKTQTQKIINTKTNHWKYAIDLFWDTGNPAEKYYVENNTYTDTYANITYDLFISSTEVDSQPETIQVRIPYYLWHKDNSENGYYSKVKPYSIGVPMAPKTNEQYSFNYTIDDHGTSDYNDDEIVFTNWRSFTAGSNIMIPVKYKISLLDTTDLSTAELKATLTAGEVSIDSPEIVYRVDTGVDLSDAGKDGTAVYNNSQLQKLLLDEKAKTESDNINKGIDISTIQFDNTKYNYVLWTGNMRVNFNQDFKLQMEDIPESGDNAELVGCWMCKTDRDLSNISYSLATGEKGNFTITGEYNTDNSDRYTGRRDIQYCALMRYPVSEMSMHGDDEIATYKNKLEVTAEAWDKNKDYRENNADHSSDKYSVDRFDKDADEVSAETNVVKYHYMPTGDIWNFVKQKFYDIHDIRYVSDDSSEGPGLVYLQNGEDTTVKLQVNHYIDGTYFGDDEASGYCYTGDVWDSNLYWNSEGIDETQYTYQPMTAEDYEYTGASVDINLHEIDRTNGQSVPIDDVQNMRFTWQKCIGGKWSDAGTFAFDDGATSMTAEIAVTDSNVTGIRIKYPEKLHGILEVIMQGTIKLKHTSTTLQGWLKDGADHIYLLNIASDRIMKYRSNGSKYLWNMPPERSNAQAKSVGQYDKDISEYGSLIDHDDRYLTEKGVPYTSDIEKETHSYNIHKENSTVIADFRVAAAEYIPGTSLGSLPEVAYKNMIINKGVFYDLLPKGYIYNAGSASVYGTQYSDTNSSGQSSSYNLPAEITSVETEDNYKKSGRQLVIFHVKISDGAENLGTDMNYMQYSLKSNYVTGFNLTYSATTTYENIAFYGQNDNNYVAFYKGSDGKGGSFLSSREAEDDGSFSYGPKGENGEYLFKDMNGDGDTTSKQVLFTSSTVNPNVQIPVETGVRIAVRADSSQFGTEDVTSVGGQYTYRLFNKVSENGEAKGMVLYDILENGENANFDQTDLIPDWKGSFDSAELVFPSDMDDVDAKIWYSTATGLDYNIMDQNYRNSDISKRQDITNTSIWSTEMPADKSKITAVAFDFRYKKNGEEMVIDSGATLGGYITMNAPKTMPDNKDNDGNLKKILTYNTVAYQALFKSKGSSDAFSNEGVRIGNPVRVSIPNCEFKPIVTKTITCEHINASSDEFAGKFQFVIRDKDGNIVQKASNDEDGNVNFEPIAYSLSDVGVHEYTISEIDPSANETSSLFIYDDTQYKVTVTVTEADDGTYELTATPTIVKVTKTEDGTTQEETISEDDIVFNNTYTAIGSFTLEGNKVLRGKELDDGEFTFKVFQEKTDENGKIVLETVKDADGKEITGTNDASGKISFGTITYGDNDIGKVYHYKIQEDIPEDAVDNEKDGITYSTVGYDATVTVKVNSEGKFIPGVSYTNNKTITNTYEASGKFTPTAEKKLTGRDLKDGEFYFTIVEGEGENAETVSTGTNDADGTITFSPIVYAKEDEPGENQSVTKTYTMTETDTGEDGIIYSKASYTMTVTLTSDGKGQIDTSAVYTDNEDGSMVTTPVFENSTVQEPPEPPTENETESHHDHSGGHDDDDDHEKVTEPETETQPETETEPETVPEPEAEAETEETQDTGILSEVGGNRDAMSDKESEAEAAIQRKKTALRTGDETAIGLWASIMVLSAAAIVLILVKNRRKRK